MTIQNQEIKEVKASFGVNAEVADAVSKNAAAPGKVQKNGDQESESIPQGSSLPKTKISMINAVMSKLSQMKKEDVEQQLASMEEDEEIDEVSDQTVHSLLSKRTRPVFSAIDTANRNDGKTAGQQSKDDAAVNIAKAKRDKAFSAADSRKNRLNITREDIELDEDEQIDELDASTLKSYKDRAVDSGRMAMITGNKPTLKKRTAGVKNVNKRLGETYKISREDIDVSEDIAAAFSGSDLSEEFKAQATEIFETAVVSSVNMKLAAMAEQAEEEYAEEMQNIEEGLTTKIDEYLDYVVEQWMEENRLAVESGLRSEVTENFLSGLRNLFAENWIDIPEEKVEVVEELAGEVEHLTATLDEEMQKNIELKKQVEKFEREIAFVEVSEGLTEMQIAKFESLAEAVDYEDAESYKENLETIRMSFFENRSEEVMESRTTLDEEFIETNETSEKKLDPSMQVYSAAISRSVKK